MGKWPKDRQTTSDTLDYRFRCRYAGLDAVLYEMPINHVIKHTLNQCEKPAIVKAVTVTGGVMEKQYLHTAERQTNALHFYTARC